MILLNDSRYGKKLQLRKTPRMPISREFADFFRHFSYDPSQYRIISKYRLIFHICAQGKPSTFFDFCRKLSIFCKCKNRITGKLFAADNN